VWKSKEARVTAEDDPRLGDPKVRSILMESVTAMSLILAGADIVTLRHPESARYIREMVADLR
jgi:acetyl-CoA decarbonylase/synthase, CODH/ACS complex subunit delta